MYKSVNLFVYSIYMKLLFSSKKILSREPNQSENISKNKMPIAFNSNTKISNNIFSNVAGAKKGCSSCGK
tara:strand:- start:267 stop:476 length:210 start_codon:yes stop_codon:yes gene_type:complete